MPQATADRHPPPPLALALSLPGAAILTADPMDTGKSYIIGQERIDVWTAEKWSFALGYLTCLWENYMKKDF